MSETPRHGNFSRAHGSSSNMTPTESHPLSSSNKEKKSLRSIDSVEKEKTSRIVYNSDGSVSPGKNSWGTETIKTGTETTKTSVIDVGGYKPDIPYGRAPAVPSAAHVRGAKADQAQHLVQGGDFFRYQRGLNEVGTGPGAVKFSGSSQGQSHGQPRGREEEKIAAINSSWQEFLFGNKSSKNESKTQSGRAEGQGVIFGPQTTLTPTRDGSYAHRGRARTVPSPQMFSSAVYIETDSSPTPEIGRSALNTSNDDVPDIGHFVAGTTAGVKDYCKLVYQKMLVKHKERLDDIEKKTRSDLLDKFDDFKQEVRLELRQELQQKIDENMAETESKLLYYVIDRVAMEVQSKVAVHETTLKNELNAHLNLHKDQLSDVVKELYAALDRQDERMHSMEKAMNNLSNTISNHFLHEPPKSNASMHRVLSEQGAIQDKVGLLNTQHEHVEKRVDYVQRHIQKIDSLQEQVQGKLGQVEDELAEVRTAVTGLIHSHHGSKGSADLIPETAFDPKAYEENMLEYDDEDLLKGGPSD